MFNFLIETLTSNTSSTLGLVDILIYPAVFDPWSAKAFLFDNWPLGNRTHPDIYRIHLNSYIYVSRDDKQIRGNIVKFIVIIRDRNLSSAVALRI
jgi:hypothetical protein